MPLIKAKDKLSNRKTRSGRVTKSKDLNKNNNPFLVIKQLSADFGISAKDMAGVLDVTPKTFSRWKQKATGMSDQQADRMLILKSIFELGRKVLGSDANVKKWMGEPVFLLEGQTPLSLLITESGRRRIESVLHQIEYGFF